MEGAGQGPEELCLLLAPLPSDLSLSLAPRELGLSWVMASLPEREEEGEHLPEEVEEEEGEELLTEREEVVGERLE